MKREKKPFPTARKVERSRNYGRRIAAHSACSARVEEGRGASAMVDQALRRMVDSHDSGDLLRRSSRCFPLESTFAGEQDCGNATDAITGAGEQDCGSAADAITGASDEGHLACKPWHRSLLLGRKFENSPRSGGSADGVASARHRAGAMP